MKRIKLEKVAVAKELYLKQLREQSAESKPQPLAPLPDVSLAPEDLMDQPTLDVEALRDTPLHSYYYENVFSLEDLYLFRGVFNFYGRRYEQAAEDYALCQQAKYEERSLNPNAAHSNEHVAESLKAYSQSSTPMLSMNSSKTDLSDVGLCSLNVHETNYNVMLCHLMTRNHPQALAKASEIIREAPGKYQKHFFLIRGLLYQALGQGDKAQKDLQRFEK